MARYRKAVEEMMAAVPGEEPGAVEPDGDEAPGSGAVTAAASDLIAAVHARDAEGVSRAIRAAFEALEAAPHYEGEHEGE